MLHYLMMYYYYYYNYVCNLILNNRYSNFCFDGNDVICYNDKGNVNKFMYYVTDDL